MKYDPDKHHRRSIRYKDYDYTQVGAYFISLVSHDRICIFGEIQNGIMQLSKIGSITKEHWEDIPVHFPTIELGAFVMMPNHVHGILIVQPENDNQTNPKRATQWVAPTESSNAKGPRKGSIGAIIGTYKMSVTREVKTLYGLTEVWQRNYYERIIRDDNEHRKIYDYIEANIDNWDHDEENPLRIT